MNIMQKNKMKSKRIFEPKEVLIKKGAVVRQMTLSSSAQFFIFIFFLAFLFWTVQTSCLYFFGNDLVRQRDHQIAELSLQNEVLIRELATYRSRVKGAEALAQSIQETHKDILNKVDELVSDELKNTKDSFSRVSKSLKQSGLSFDKLFQKVYQSQGVGGPFIPDEGNEMMDSVLTEQIGNIYQKLSKLETFSYLKEQLPLGEPLDNIRVTAAFGRRQDPFTGKLAQHEGIDLGAPEGSPVYVTSAGRVKRAFTNGAYGKFVEVEHEMGIMTRYAHLSKILVKKGDMLQIGDSVGLVGNTGRSTGDHLHYEILINKTPVNPYRFIQTKREKNNV